MTNNTQIERPLALVLGATGGIGGAMALKLLQRGWRVRALSRKSPEAADTAAIDWVKGDCMKPGDVIAAAKGTSLIVHAVNPPGYRDWEKLVMPMLDSTIAAAKSAGARIVLPGTIYNFGPDAFPVLREDSPQQAHTEKGRIRVEMERRLQQAADEGTPVLIVRAGDFFGPGAANSWFSQGVIRQGKPVKSLSMPNSQGVGHTWAYLPDVAETMMRLIERGDELPAFARFHMRGLWEEDGSTFASAIERVTGRRISKSHIPWWAFKLASPFHRLSRELVKMRYLWQTAIRMDNARLVAFLGEEPHTPLDVAMRETLVANRAL